MPHVDLLELPYFEGITLDDMVSLVERMEPAQFESGATIVVEGDPPPPLYIATGGSVARSRLWLPSAWMRKAWGWPALA